MNHIGKLHEASTGKIKGDNWIVSVFCEKKVESAFLFSLFKPLSQSPANTRVKFPLLPWIETLLEVCSRHNAVII